MSEVWVVLDYDHCQESQPEFLLAVSGLRRDLERIAGACGSDRRWGMALNDVELARELCAHIAADRVNGGGPVKS